MANSMVKLLTILFLVSLSCSLEIKSFLTPPAIKKNFFSLSECNLNKDNASLTCSAQLDDNTECYYDMKTKIARCVSPEFVNCKFDKKDILIKCSYGEYSICSPDGQLRKIKSINNEEIFYPENLKCLSYNPTKKTKLNITHLFGNENGMLTFFGQEFYESCHLCGVRDGNFGCVCSDGQGNYNQSTIPMNQYIRWDFNSGNLINLKDHLFDGCQSINEGHALTCHFPNNKSLVYSIDIQGCLENNFGTLIEGYGFNFSCVMCKAGNSKLTCAACQAGVGESKQDSSIELKEFLEWRHDGLFCKNGGQMRL